MLLILATPLLIVSFALLSREGSAILLGLGTLVYSTGKKLARRHRNNCLSQMAPQSSPHNTIVTFDLHGVLFKPDYKKIRQLLWHSNHKATLLRHAFKFKLLYALFILWRKDSVLEQYFDQLTALCPRLANCIQLLENVANAQIPNRPTISIVKQLKERGYTLQILSNISEKMLENLNKLFPEIFTLFHTIKTTSSATNYLAKPKPSFFHAYQTECNPDNKTVIFVDDWQKNVDAAKSLGIIGIHYRNSKQLHSQLKQLLTL